MIQVGGRNTIITVLSTAWKELTTDSSTPLKGRKFLIVQNKSASRISISFDTTKVYKEGLELGVGHVIQIPVHDAVKVYARAKTASAGHRVLVMEIA
jgi:hypothetical protein